MPLEVNAQIATRMATTAITARRIRRISRLSRFRLRLCGAV